MQLSFDPVISLLDVYLCISAHVQMTYVQRYSSQSCLGQPILEATLVSINRGLNSHTLKSFADKEEQGERKGREKEESFVLM